MSESHKYKNSPYMKRSYAEDMSLEAFDTPFRKKCMILGIVFFVIFPFIAPPFFLHISNLIAIACMGAMALNLVTGTAGLLSLGHAGFMCAGAFAVGILASRTIMPFSINILTAGIVGAILGMISGLPSLRLKGIYLGISTLAMHYIITYFASEYQHYSGFGYGIIITDASVGTLVFSNKEIWYFFLWPFVCLTGLFIANLMRSRPGRAWMAIRDRDIAAKAIGINVGLYKLYAFVISSAIVSIQGSLYAYYTNLVAVEQYSFYLTVSYLAMIVIGGVGSLLGSIMGAFLVTLIPYFLLYVFDSLEVSYLVKDYFYALESGIFGLLIIIFLLFEPMGLVEIWRRIRTFCQLWPFKYRPLMITKR